MKIKIICMLYISSLFNIILSSVIFNNTNQTKVRKNKILFEKIYDEFFLKNDENTKHNVIKF